MSNSPEIHNYDISPERIAEITRRARIERSRALWRMLEGLFKSRASDDLPGSLEIAAKPRC